MCYLMVARPVDDAQLVGFEFQDVLAGRPERAPRRTSVRCMFHVQPELASHPDRLRWNARYGDGFAASFDAHPLAVRALSMQLPDGPVLDLACGLSGSVLLAASAGRRVMAVDASDVALDMLGQEASRRGLLDLISLVHGDLRAWRPQAGSYSLVLCTGYWDRDLFSAAADGVAPGGLLGWEAFTAEALLVRPGMPPEWCLAVGEPASLLPPGFEILSQDDLLDTGAGTKRRLLARRSGSTNRAGQLIVARLPSP